MAMSLPTGKDNSTGKSYKFKFESDTNESLMCNYSTKFCNNDYI